jgi:Flp pilus assembly pilin Flp
MIGLFTKVRSAWLHATRQFRSEDGAVATEYGLLLVLIALAIIAAAGFLGAAIAGVFDDATTELGGVTG